MKLILDAAFGGPEHHKITHRLIINMRKLIKREFQNKIFGEDILCIKYFIGINGSISQYYDKSGIFNGKYFKNKKEIRLDIQIIEISEKTTYKKAINLLENFIIESIKRIEEIVERKKLIFSIKDFSKSIENVFKELKNENNNNRVEFNNNNNNDNNNNGTF